MKDYHKEFEEIKRKVDMDIIAHYYMNSYPKTVAEVAYELGLLEYFPETYVYDCIRDPKMSTVLTQEEYQDFSSKLNSSRRSYIRKHKSLEKVFRKR